MKKQECTIYDLARELNISPATVSRALQNSPVVSKKTKNRIIMLAREMGYRSNTIASNLRRKKTNTLGVIVPRLNSHFMSSAISGTEKIANLVGYNLIITQSQEKASKEAFNVNTLFNNRVDGLVVSLAGDTTDFSAFQVLLDREIPVIFFDRITEELACPGFIIDNHQAGQLITTHLIEQGCKNVVHITGDLNRNVYADRCEGYKKALTLQGLPVREEFIMATNLSIEAGVEAANRIKSLSPAPDGIFVANDACAISCMNTLKKNGFRIPEDIAVAGFNNDPYAALVEPALTTIDYPGEEMGEMVIKSLIEHLENKQDLRSTNRIILRSSLIIRESTLRTEKSQ